MAVASVQSNSDFVDFGSTSAPCSWLFARTAGNILLATVTSRGDPTGQGAPIHAQGDLFLEGETSETYTLMNTASTSDHTISTWFRVATSADVANNTVRFSHAQSNPGIPVANISIHIEEFSHDFTDPVISSALASGDSGGTSVETLNPGPSGAFESAPVLLYGAATWRNGGSSGSWPIAPTNSGDLPNRSDRHSDTSLGEFVSRCAWEEQANSDSRTIEWRRTGTSNASACVLLNGVVEGGAPSGSTGTVAATDTADTAAVSGSVTTSSTVDGTDTADSAALVGTVTLPTSTGTVAASDIPDTASLVGEVTSSGTVAGTDTPDSAAVTGTVAVSGAVAGVDNPDSASFVGTVGDLVIGSVDGTDTTDTADLSGDVTATGTVAATDTADTAAVTGVVVGAPATGTITATDTPDSAAFVGTVVSNDSTGTIATTDQPDLAAVVGFVTITGTIGGTDTPDSASLVGTVIGDFAPVSTPTRTITDLTAARAITDQSDVRTIIEP